jgi:hypothetical protein
MLTPGKAFVDIWYIRGRGVLISGGFMCSGGVFDEWQLSECMRPAMPPSVMFPGCVKRRRSALVLDWYGHWE